MADKFEIAFSFDTTGSMYSCLEQVRSKLGEMVRELRNKIPGIRIAIFAHGDYCDARNSYVTKYFDFSNDANQLCNFVATVGATHGGDAPECYELVLREAQEKLSWSANSQKALVMIGDAEPHPANFPENTRRIDWRNEILSLRKRDIKVHGIQCNYYHQSEYFYQEIAARTFGYYWKLENFNKVKDVLMEICFREAGIGSSSFVPASTSYIPSYQPSMSVFAKPPSPSPSPTPASRMSEGTCSDVSDDENPFGMKCLICKIVKLPNEFPPNPVAEECEHYTSACMRCVVRHVKETGRCYHEGCDVEIQPDGQSIRFIEATLDRMFLDYAKVLADSRKAAFGVGSFITVSTMNGDTAWIKHRSDVRMMTICQVKLKVEEELGIPVNNQKLLYNDRVLKDNKGAGQPACLSDYDVTENAALSLIVPLYCIPENLDHVVFDLSWEFPKVNPDFLDASCLAFNKTEFIQVIDWNHSTNDYYLKGAVIHSAKNETRGGGRFGHQTIEVRLKNLPTTVTHLYFILSSWRAPNLSAFTKPSLQFYAKSDPGTNLCSTTFGHALASQAVAMCSVVRVGRSWNIFECDTLGCVDGNTKKYNPICERVAYLIANE